jgi:hypothetical protein
MHVFDTKGCKLNWNVYCLFTNSFDLTDSLNKLLSLKIFFIESWTTWLLIGFKMA